MGPHAERINGTYLPTNDKVNGKLVFVKLEDASRCIFYATNEMWHVASMNDKDSNKNAGSATTENGLMHPLMAKAWKVAMGDGVWQPQSLEATCMVCLGPSLIYILSCIN